MSFSYANTLGQKKEPFIFISDFKAQNIEVIPLKELSKHDIEFSIDATNKIVKHTKKLQIKAIDFILYKQKFDAVIEKIKSGETYILNLTQATHIDTLYSLKEIYSYANAHYKLRFKDEFVCFSPETFVKIKGSKISTYPMKGTINASLVDAQKIILSDVKELAEHTMIVDLLRNDLSIMAKDVKVEKFRYISKIYAGSKELLQVSSKISGIIGKSWHENIGTILESLLPAGSISGAPKRSTLKIIDEIEDYDRGYFSGVFGFYDGKSFDSAVMIRFIEKTPQGLLYKSGGGITLDSDVTLEYNELQDKIYLP